MHIGSVAAIDTDGLTVYADGKRRTEHGHETANVRRGDHMLEHGALVGRLLQRCDGRALALRLLAVAFQVASVIVWPG